jgi:hypothetical protein
VAVPTVIVHSVAVSATGTVRAVTVSGPWWGTTLLIARSATAAIRLHASTPPTIR